MMHNFVSSNIKISENKEIDKILTCPACDNTLTKINVHNVIVDICQNGCGGIWFDKNELNNFDEQSENADELLNIQKDKNIEIDFTRERKCPRCDIKLSRHFSSIKMKIEVDECTRCEGLCLDDKELKDIRNEYINNADKEYFHNYAVELNHSREDEENEMYKKAHSTLWIKWPKWLIKSVNNL